VHEPAREVQLGGAEDDRVEVVVAEQEVAARCEHAGDLAEEGVDGQQGLERVVADRRADAGVLERQRLVEVGDHRLQARIGGERGLELRLAPLDADQLDLGPEPLAQRGERQPAAAAEVDDARERRLRERRREAVMALAHCAPSRSSRSARASPR
jgi:hypothetical protein